MADLEIIQQIKDTIEKIRPFIIRDGGDCQFSRFDEETGIVYVRFMGACVGCGLIDDTLSIGIATILKEEVKGVSDVRLETEPTIENLDSAE